MGWVLFGIIWLISPLILLPLSIHRGHKAEKYENFINELYSRSRITEQEKNLLIVESRIKAAKEKEDRYVQKSPQPKKQADTGWICECGYRNNSSAKTCSTCGKIKAELPPVTYQAKPAAALWVCNECGFHNAKDINFCSNCGSKKPVIISDDIAENIFGDAKTQKPAETAAASAQTPEKSAYAPVDSASAHSTGETAKTVGQTNMLSPESKAEEKWACTSCGYENLPIARFCAKCGLKRDGEAVSAEVAAISDNSAAAVTYEYKEQKTAAVTAVADEKKYFEPKQEAKPSKVDIPVFRDDMKPSVVKPGELRKNKQKKEKRHYDSSTILFGIGVVFVILAGIIFSTAFWVKWSHITRTGAIAVASVFFFTISRLAKKKFKLDSTSGAMYVTGSVFTAITVVTAGYLKIFGDKFSLDGDMKWLFFMFGMIVLSLCSYGAQKIYKKPECRYLTAFSIAVGATFLTAQFAQFTAEPSKVFGLLTAVIGAVCSGVYVWYARRDIEISKLVRNIFIIFRGFYAFAGAAVLLVEIFNFKGFSLCGWGIVLASIGECFIWFFGFEGKIRTASLVTEAVFVGIAAFMLRFEFDDINVYYYLITAFGVIGAAVYDHLEAKGKNIVDASAVKYALRIVFAMLTLPALGMHFTEWGVCEWVMCGVWTAEMFGYGIIKKNFVHLIAAGIFVEAGLLEVLFGEYFPVENTALAVTLFSVAFGAVYSIAKTKKKDIAFADNAYYFMRILLTVTVLPVIINVPSVPLSAVGWVILGVFCAEALVYGIAYRTNGYLMLHGIALLFMLTKAKEVGFLGEWFTLAVTVFAAVAYIVYIKTESFNCDIVVFVVRCGMCVFAVHDLFEHCFSWKPQDTMVYLILLTELTVYAILKKRAALLAVQCILVILGNLQVMEMLDAEKGIFFSWLFVAVGTVVYVLLRHYNKARIKADIIVGSVRVIYSLLLFALVINIEINGLNRWYLATMLIIAGELLVYAIVRKSNVILGIHGGVIFMILFAVRDANWLGRYFTLWVTIFAVTGCAVYYIFKKMNKLRFNADKAVIFTRCMLALFMVYDLGITFFDWETLEWVIFALSLAELTVYAILEKSESILAVQCVFITIGNIELFKTEHSDMFVFFSWVFIAVGTAVYVFLRERKKTLFNADQTVIGMRIIYAFFSLCSLNYLYRHDVSGWIVASALLIAFELGLYGILFKSKAMLFANCAIMVITLEGACSLLRLEIAAVDKRSAQFIFSAGLTVLILLYRYVKQLNTKASDTMLMVLLFGNSIILLYSVTIPYGVISMLAFEVFLVITAFSDEHYLAKPVKLMLSVPILITCDSVCDFFSAPVNSTGYIPSDLRAFKVMVLSGTAILLGAVAYAVGFGIKHDEKKYSKMKYSFEIFGILAGADAISRLPSHLENPMSTALFIGCAMIIAAAVLMYSVMQTDKNNIASIVPLGMLYFGVYRTFELSCSGTDTMGNFTIPVSIVMFAALTIVSRSRNSQSLKIVTEDGKKIFDTAGIGVLFGLGLCEESSWFNERAVVFVMLLEIAAFLANLYRSGNTQKTNKLMLTLSAGAAGAALIERPFMVFEGSIWMTKIIILIIVLFGIAMKYIWRDNERFADESSKGIFMVSYVLLLIDALMNQTVANSIIVLCTSLAILLFAFRRRSKRWFLISAAGLAGLTLYTTKDFFTSLAWWLYLLIAGLLLITIASVNEYLKSKGRNLKEMTGSYLDTWKW